MDNDAKREEQRDLDSQVAIPESRAAVEKTLLPPDRWAQLVPRARTAEEASR